jgi:hypothetical protein
MLLLCGRECGCRMWDESASGLPSVYQLFSLLATSHQGRIVRGTTAPSPASVLLQPGDKVISVNGMNVEMWGKHRVQEALAYLTRDMSPETPSRLQFFRAKPKLGSPTDYSVVTGT